MISRLVAVLALALLCVGRASAADPAAAEAVFRKANQAYKEGRYPEAFDGYQEVLRTHGGGDIYYNMGNAAFRLGRPGLAILNYERARRLIPRDADLLFNLSHVRDQLQDGTPAPESVAARAFFWVDSLTSGELFLIFAVCNALFWGLMILRLRHRPEWTYHAFFVLLAVWLLAGASFGLKWQQLRSDDRAVILRGEASILAGPDERETALFQLHEGALVRHERTEDGWALVRLSRDRRGWVRADALERVLPPVTSPGALSPG